MISGMGHPLIGDVSDKSMDELSEIISGLTKKLNYAYRIQHQAMINQLTMTLNTYRSEYAVKQDALWKEESGVISGKIDIQ
jgi:hypothetical protein